MLYISNTKFNITYIMHNAATCKLQVYYFITVYVLIMNCTYLCKCLIYLQDSCH